MWVEFDESVDELHQRASARWAPEIATLVFCGLNATAWTLQSTTDAERERRIPGNSGAVHETFLKTTLELPSQTHVSTLACELAIEPSSENITALRAVHRLARSGSG